MHKRFWIICLVMGLGLLVLSVLGLSSLGMHEKGLRAERQHDFINVAEQVRFDIKKKLDAFMLAEQSRPYTDYQYYYVPVASNDATALVRSPLATSFSNGLAYGYFQLDSTSQITNPYAAVPEQASVPVKDYLDNITQNLLPSLVNGESLQARRIKPSEPEKEYDFTDKFSFRSSSTRSRSVEQEVAFALAEPVTDVELKQVKAISSPVQGKKVASKSKADTGRRSRYPISLDESQQTTQVVNYSRDNVDLNEYNTRLQSAQSQGGGGGRQGRIEMHPFSILKSNRRRFNHMQFHHSRQLLDNGKWVVRLWISSSNLVLKLKKFSISPARPMLVSHKPKILFRHGSSRLCR